MNIQVLTDMKIKIRGLAPHDVDLTIGEATQLRDQLTEALPGFERRPGYLPPKFNEFAPAPGTETF